MVIYANAHAVLDMFWCSLGGGGQTLPWWVAPRSTVAFEVSEAYTVFALRTGEMTTYTSHSSPESEWALRLSLAFAMRCSAVTKFT